MVPEACLESTEHGLSPTGEGWFILNARGARWLHGQGRGAVCLFEAEPAFPQVGINVSVLAPREPMAIYHRENDREDFLVLSGEALLIVEGQERPLRQWDFVHVDETALRHDAGVEQETTDADQAYGRFGHHDPTRHRAGWLPG